jgi:hypothetical protein
MVSMSSLRSPNDKCLVVTKTKVTYLQPLALVKASTCSVTLSFSMALRHIQLFTIFVLTNELRGILIS